MDSLNLVELGMALGEEFPGWAVTDEEYAGIDGSLTVGKVYDSIAKVHEPTDLDDVWLRLRQVVARCHGVSADSLQSGTRLIPF